MNYDIKPRIKDTRNKLKITLKISMEIQIEIYCDSFQINNYIFGYYNLQIHRYALEPTRYN